MARIPFLKSILEKPREFTEGVLILGRGFNFTLDPTVDTSLGASHISLSKLKRLKKCVRLHQSVDVWRVLHPTQRDFTFYSHSHITYTGIDFFLIPHVFLPRVWGAAIGSITISEHVPLDVDISPSPAGAWHWRLNDTLFQDPTIQKELLQKLQLFFQTNDTT